VLIHREANVTGTIALVAAGLFVAVALYRLTTAAPALAGRLGMVLAFAAALFGAAHWQGGGDSRWIVGSLLIFFALPVTAFSARSRGLTLAAAALGVLATALYALASVTAL
jgi:O-antigen ligase